METEIYVDRDKIIIGKAEIPLRRPFSYLESGIYSPNEREELRAYCLHELAKERGFFKSGHLPVWEYQSERGYVFGTGADPGNILGEIPFSEVPNYLKYFRIHYDTHTEDISLPVESLSEAEAEAESRGMKAEPKVKTQKMGELKARVCLQPEDATELSHILGVFKNVISWQQLSELSVQTSPRAIPLEGMEVMNTKLAYCPKTYIMPSGIEVNAGKEYVINVKF